jgi:hypothetical protein
MGLRLSRRAALSLSLAVLAVIAVAVPAGASAARILYADGSGHPLDATRLATFGGNTAVDPPGVDGFDACSDAEWAAGLARTDFDVLVVGETAPNQCFGPDPTDLSSSTLQAIGNYVRNGKPIIVLGAHDDENDFLNAVFGFSTTNATEDSGENLTGTLQPGAAGTPFAGGPATLLSADLTEILGSTPGTTIYSGPEGTWVFMVPFGLGTVTYLGWDFCEGGCGSPPNEDDWYRVLDRATRVSGGFTIDAITRNKKKGTATITVSAQFPGDLVATGKGVKFASAGGAAISKAVGAGKSQLLIKAKGKKKKKLKRKGKVKLNVAVTYTPTGASPHSQSAKVKLKKKLKKKK